MIIRQAHIEENKYIAKLHIAVFPNFFLSTLGEKFLTTYYKVVLRHPETICLFAETESGEVCGYVLGRIKAKGYLKRIVKSAPITFCWEGVKLMFSRPASLLRLVKNLDKKRDDKQVKDNQDYAEIGLIGVMPEYKGLGIGRALFNEFIGMIKKQGVAKISLTTDAEKNDNTLAAYKAWGFEVLYLFTTYPSRKMYRLIKNI